MKQKYIDYINNGHEKKFYKSWTWQKKRAEIIARDNFECQRCKDLGKVNKGETVHHVKHLKDYPELGVDDNNLITLCNNCHNYMHPEKGYIRGIKKVTHLEKWE